MVNQQPDLKSDPPQPDKDQDMINQDASQLHDNFSNRDIECKMNVDEQSLRADGDTATSLPGHGTDDNPNNSGMAQPRLDPRSRRDHELNLLFESGYCRREDLDDRCMKFIYDVDPLSAAEVRSTPRAIHTFFWLATGAIRRRLRIGAGPQQVPVPPRHGRQGPARAIPDADACQLRARPKPQVHRPDRGAGAHEPREGRVAVAPLAHTCSGRRRVMSYEDEDADADADDVF